MRPPSEVRKPRSEEPLPGRRPSRRTRPISSLTGLPDAHRPLDSRFTMYFPSCDAMRCDAIPDVDRNRALTPSRHGPRSTSFPTSGIWMAFCMCSMFSFVSYTSEHFFSKRGVYLTFTSDASLGGMHCKTRKGFRPRGHHSRPTTTRRSGNFSSCDRLCLRENVETRRSSRPCLDHLSTRVIASLRSATAAPGNLLECSSALQARPRSTTAR